MRAQVRCKRACASSPLRKVLANVLAFLIAIVGFGIAVWVVVPGSSIITFAAAAAAPEAAPFLFLYNAIALAIVIRIARGISREITTAVLAIGLGFSCIPLLLLGPAIHAANDELARATEHGAIATSERIGYNPLESFVPPNTAAIVRTRVQGAVIDAKTHASLALDVYHAPQAGARPTVLVIYGGAWSFGDLLQTEALDRTIAASGYTVIALDYRHAPTFRFPTQLGDIFGALRYIRANAPALGVDLNRVAILGRSAGGELALIAGYHPGPIAFRAVIGYYAPTDLTQGWNDLPKPDPANVRKILTAYLGTGPNLLPDAYRAASPSSYVAPNLPPTLLIGGVRDELVKIEFQRAFAAKLRAAGDTVAAIEIPWSNHAFDSLPTGLGGQIAVGAVRRFLAAYL